VALQSQACATCPRAESDRRAAGGEPFALRYRVPRGEGPDASHFVDGVYGAQSRSSADEVEDFALLRSDRHADLPPRLVRR
jgi:hypothetical protein